MKSRRPRTEDEKKKISEALKGRKLSQTHKENLRNAAIDFYLNVEEREKLSKRLLDAPRITCPHCSHIGSVSNMKRYHFDNCKLKNVINEPETT